MTWHDAFLKQAHSDYSVFINLNKSRYPLCHRLHYLQMATEKLAKAYQCDKNNSHPPKTHLALLKMLRTIKGNPNIRRLFGFENQKMAYIAYINKLMPIANQIESLAPIGGDFDKLNPEYPWKNPIGRVNCPAEYKYSEIKPTDLIKIQGLIRTLFKLKGLSIA